MSYVKLVAGLICLGVGLFVMVSGLLWASIFHAVWGVPLIAVGLWQLLTSRQKGKVKNNAD